MSDPLADVARLPGVPDAVARAREAVDRLLGHRILRRRGVEVAAAAALRGARASAALEGASVSLEELRGGLTNDPVVSGALRVSAELGLLPDTWRTAPRQALARLHTLAAADGVEPHALGRPRADERARDPLGLGAAPPPEDAAARIGALSDLLISPTVAPAIVVAAVAHGELLTLRPFGWGDGVVARAASRLVLIERGLDPKSLIAPEVGHAEAGAAYAQSARAYASGDPAGVARWIRHCAEAIELGVRDALAVCEALARG